MRSIIPASVASSRLERIVERRQRAVSSGASRPFGAQLTSALGGSGASAAGRASRQRTDAPATVRQNSATAASPRLNDDPTRAADGGPVVFITPFGPSILRPAQATSTPTAAQPAAPEAAPAAAGPSTPPASIQPALALDVLREALRKANIEPSGLNLYYEEVPVNFPGSTLVNRWITCEAGGIKESYDVALMMKNPWLTAFEIRRQLGYKS